MKLKVNSMALYKQMVQGAKIAPSKATQEILRHVKIEATDKQLVVTGSDLTTTIRHYVEDVEVIEPGSVLVPGGKLLKVLKGMGDEEVTITIGKGLRCVVSARTAHFKIAGDDPADYPDLPQWDPEGSFEVDADDLIQMVNRVHPAASKELGRWAMKGVRIEMTRTLLRTVGTDGRRLAMCDRPGDYPSEIAVTVPQDGLILLPNLVHDGDKLSMKLDDIHLHIKGAKMELMARRLTGDYPPYASVIPQSNLLRVEFDRSEFIKTLTRATLLVSKSSNAVRFIFEEGNLSVEAWEGHTEEVHVSHPIDWPGDERMVIGYNPHHLLEAVNLLSDSTFVLEIENEKTPAVMRESDEDTSYLHLIVPVNLPN